MSQFDLSQTIQGLMTPALTEPGPRIEGRITRLIGLTIEAVGLQVAVGDNCLIILSPSREIEAEVVGFSGDRVYLMPLHAVEGLSAGAKVVPMGAGRDVPVGFGLLGRVLNGVGEPLDGKGPFVLPADCSSHSSHADLR